jgi:hypothetical protein
MDDARKVLVALFGGDRRPCRSISVKEHLSYDEAHVLTADSGRLLHRRW